MSRMKMRRTVATASLIAVAGAVSCLTTACGSASSTHTASTQKPASTQSQTSTESQTSTQNADTSGSAAALLAPYLKEPTVADVAPVPPLTKAPPTGQTIYYINTGGPAAAPDLAGLQAAVKPLHWKLHSLVYSETDPTGANSAVETAVSNHAGGIVMTGIAAASVKAGIAQANAAHIPVVSEFANEPLNAHPGFYEVADTSATDGQDVKAVALAFCAAAKQAGKPADVGVVTSSQIPALGPYEHATQAAIPKYCPGATTSLINVSAADLLSGASVKSVVSAVQANPKINYVEPFGSLEGGLRAALNAAGMTSVQLGGIIPSTVQNQEVKSGADLFWVQSPNGLECWNAIDAIARALTGGDPEIHADQNILPWVIEKSNVGNIDLSALPDYPQGYEALFEKAWHVR